VIVLLACGLRVGMVFALKAHRSDAGMYEHKVIAAALARGEGFRYPFYDAHANPTSQQAPAVPFLLSLCFLAAGPATDASKLLYMLAVNVPLFAAATVATWCLGRRMWGSSVGLWAAASLAVYPPLVYAVTRIQAASWSVCWLLIALALAAETLHRRSWRWAAAAGAAAGVGMLGEPILLAAAGLMFLALLVSALRRPRRLGMAAACVLAAVVVLLPWMLRNREVHGQFVFVKSTFWYAFWQGNHPGASGTDKRLPEPALRRRLAWATGGAGLEAALNEARAQAVSVDEDLTLARRDRLWEYSSEMRKVELFRCWALQFLKENPGQYLRLCGVRAGHMLWFDATNPRTYVLAYRLSYLVLAVLGLIGVVTAVLHRRPVYWRLPVLAGLGIFLFHTLTITSARFRLPIEALLMLPAAVVLDSLAGSFRRRGARAANPQRANG
jgi:4-amino-4-deoxy-L-arabinose transferase-like glycosyltransferase